MLITMYTGVRISFHVSKQISTCIDNLIKRYRAFRRLGEKSLVYVSVCINKTISNNLIHVHVSHSHHYLKGINEEKERVLTEE